MMPNAGVNLVISGRQGFTDNPTGKSFIAFN